MRCLFPFGVSRQGNYCRPDPLWRRSAHGVGSFEWGRESACKNLPTHPGHSRFCPITLLTPLDSRRYAFGPKTPIFGPTASVLHYNVSPELIANLAYATLGIRIIGYVADFGAPIPSSISSDALSTLRNYCSTSRVLLKDSKCPDLPTNSFLGLKGAFPSIDNNMTLSISLAGGNRLRGSEFYSKSSEMNRFPMRS